MKASAARTTRTRVLLIALLVCSASSALAAEQVVIGTMEVRVKDSSPVLYDGSSADRAWLDTWASEPHGRRDVVLEGHAPGGVKLPRYSYHACTLEGVRPGAQGIEWVGMTCESVHRAD